MQHVSVSLSGFLKVNVMLTFKIKFSVNGKASFLDPLMFTKKKTLAKRLPCRDNVPEGLKTAAAVRSQRIGLSEVGFEPTPPEETAT